MKTLCRMKYGSHLYGTDTELSDTDIKGVYLPDIKDVILQRASKCIVNKTNHTNSKNIASDIDEEYYSLHHFLKIGYNGDTTFLDMIHCNSENLMETSEEWEFLRVNRYKFYTKSVKSYLGYCQTQAAKYGLKGSRIAALEALEAELEYFKDDERFHEAIPSLPTGDHVKVYYQKIDTDKQDIVYEICSRKLMGNTKVGYVKAIVKEILKSYGERAKMARNSEGIDWKAVSHAFRVGYQLKSLYTIKDIIFPLPEATYLKDIKQGKFHYVEDGIALKLEELISEVGQLSQISDFPDKVDSKYFDEWLYSIYHNKLV